MNHRKWATRLHEIANVLDEVATLRFRNEELLNEKHRLQLKLNEQTGIITRLQAELDKMAEGTKCTSVCVDNYCPIHGIKEEAKVETPTIISPEPLPVITDDDIPF